MNMHKLAVDTAVVSVRKFEKGRAIFTPPSKQSPPLYYESLSWQLVEPEFQSQLPQEQMDV